MIATIEPIFVHVAGGLCKVATVCDFVVLADRGHNGLINIHVLSILRCDCTPETWADTVAVPYPTNSS